MDQLGPEYKSWIDQEQKKPDKSWHESYLPKPLSWACGKIGGGASWASEKIPHKKYVAIVLAVVVVGLLVTYGPVLAHTGFAHNFIKSDFIQFFPQVYHGVMSTGPFVLGVAATAGALYILTDPAPINWGSSQGTLAIVGSMTGAVALSVFVC